jgi:branched-chain amino acid aminotransferase
MIQTWHITPTDNIKLNMDATTLDDVTRQLSEGYYSTFRTFDSGSRVLGLTAHLQRLYGPVSSPEVDESFLRRQLSVLLESYRPGEARIRAIMTRRGQVYVGIAPLVPLPGEVYEKGVCVETTELHREHPRLKSTSFIGQSNAERKHIAQEGIFEALLIKDGKILEGMTSNFFYVRHQRAARSGAKSKREVFLCTARYGILLGVTRENVIEIARRRGMEIKFEPLRLDQLNDLSEAFITSSSRGIVPVIRIDDFTVGEGSPGPITRELMTAYKSYVSEKAEKI